VKLSRLVQAARTADGEVIPNAEYLLGYTFFCPGCKGHHTIYTTQKNEVGAIWEFNGDLENPTFTPSIKSSYVSEEGAEPQICHLVLTDGELHFCADSTHALAGCSQSLADVDED
jgi:hypothetical protein